MTGFRRILTIAAAGLLAQPLGAATPPPAPPAPPPPPPASSIQAPAKAHFALYDAIFAGIDMKVLAHNAAVSIAVEVIKKDPTLVRLQQRRPHLSDRIAGAIEPYLALWMERVKAKRRGEGAAIMAHHLTAAEAQRTADFYASPLGQRIMRTMAGNLSFDGMLQAQQEPQSMTRSEGQQRDIKRAVTTSMPGFEQSLTPQDRKQLAALADDPAFEKVGADSAEFMRQPDPPFSTYATEVEMSAFRAALDKVVTEEMAAS